MTSLYLGGKAVRLAARDLIGQGGEAEVFDLGDGTVLKRYKPPSHPDFDGDDAARAQAQARLDEHQRKLPAFPRDLPPQVVTPMELAFSDRAGDRLAGYRMRRAAGVPLHHLGEPRWRREHALASADAIAPLRDLAEAVAGLHRRGVVIGDFSDLNVLVDGARAHLIDADSFQFGAFRCAMFSERFLDPRLCAPGTLAPVAPHDPDSDWFAFTVMLVRTLLLVGPWGGVYQPADPARRCTPTQRVARRISIFEPEVTLPRAAAPLAALPDEVREHLRAVIHGTRRGAPPPWLWDRLHLVRCAGCGLEHARARCPACAVTAPPLAHHGRLVVRQLAPSEVARGSYAVPRGAPVAPAKVWLEADALWRQAPLGRERIGGVVGAQTWAFASATFGAGLYRVGGLTVGLAFDPRRGPLDDRLRLPPILGEIAMVHGAVGAELAWLWLTVAHAGVLTTHAVVIDPKGRLIVYARFAGADADAPWLPGVGGACAVGPHLLVPTDAGVVRLEVCGGAIVATRTFPETAPWTCAGDQLAPAPGGLDVVRARDALRLTLS